MWRFSHHIGKGDMGDVCCRIVIGHYAISDPPFPFHSLWMTTQITTPLYWFPLSVYRFPEQGGMTWPPPAPLVYFAHFGAGSTGIPPAGAGYDPLS